MRRRKDVKPPEVNVVGDFLNKGAVEGKPVAAAKKAAKSHMASANHADEVISSLAVSGPTKTARPRVEVCARVSNGHKIYVHQFIPSIHPNWPNIVSDLEAKVAAGGATRNNLKAFIKSSA